MGMGSKIESWVSKGSHKSQDFFGKLFMSRGPPKPLTAKYDLLALDNTAYILDGKWHAEVVISVFNRKDEKRWHKFEEEILKLLNVPQGTVRWSRVEYFLAVPISNVNVDLREAGGGPEFTVGPTQYNGIMAQEVAIRTAERNWTQNETTVFDVLAPSDFPDKQSFSTIFAEETGWGIISDIDDTIKVTDVLNREELLKHTFLDHEGIPVNGMPDLYRSLMTHLNNPTIFYLSASPWQLYPYLREFTKKNYPFGQVILRDMSYVELTSFITTLTIGTQEFKEDEMDKIHRWLPNKQFLCIGDSTQTDPEAYGTIYRKYPGWIKFIWIRRVSGVDPEKEIHLNSPERFEKAFEGIPPEAWRTFTDPMELADSLPEGYFSR